MYGTLLSKQNDVVLVPRASDAQTTCGITQNQRRSALDCDSLQLASCKEGNEAAIRGPERKTAKETFYTTNGLRSEGANRTNPQTQIRYRSSRKKSHIAAVRRNGGIRRISRRPWRKLNLESGGERLLRSGLKVDPNENRRD